MNFACYDYKSTLVRVMRNLLLYSAHLIRVTTGNQMKKTVWNFHVLSHLLLNYICKLHWNFNTMFVCQVISLWFTYEISMSWVIYYWITYVNSTGISSKWGRSKCRRFLWRTVHRNAQRRSRTRHARGFTMVFTIKNRAYSYFLVVIECLWLQVFTIKNREYSYFLIVIEKFHEGCNELKVSYLANMLCEVIFLRIYIWNFHVLNHLLLIYMCKLHWNLNTMFEWQVIYLWFTYVISMS